MNAELQYQIEQFLYEKSALCDAKAWDDYLALFTEDCEFHLPQWDSEHEYTQDPRKGLSLIYYANRTGLEDRVFRLRTGKAASAVPLPRTVHFISNVRISPQADGALSVKANWKTSYYRHSTSEDFYGYATYTLVPHQQSWRIARKHVVLLNDTINSVLDFYHL
ncbi:anthranilate 1,2-dioxygenase small subunit [Shimwellia blattae]|uniref:Putative oxidoreductase n=1 Tax=Shimwellia blattae (strain ATCC 29907 / DSM 4481 / JCM 1650 / NBRC 105725 / CDC 9005-74) TaxID=630626 RepID=I2B707_SHIBC|nr:anthranilate 1,2-dioxygenase small subunit [Shimwellia blattae]AFJ46311.1 putative oxidoreductase [Shimwellia blattae DSM 4481 = NBRC 105725]GAB79894.1 3-phenylpropionate/cinnamic acid dioxygenase beta subunit [Shimwellia blattae DSM 4481 = NBRC 105725]VDY63776.1 Anthranilate 1,2-dioxygenase small subunit [Shimwellia blattae]VEC21915.1 Anthranilate 1,2-dioxygenase small subunit [Shimwellia blattae]